LLQLSDRDHPVLPSGELRHPPPPPRRSTCVNSAGARSICVSHRFTQVDRVFHRLTKVDRGGKSPPGSSL
jgi:hypothetical protein